jgi:hypothetical protein
MVAEREAPSTGEANRFCGELMDYHVGPTLLHPVLDSLTIGSAPS